MNRLGQEALGEDYYVSGLQLTGSVSKLSGYIDPDPSHGLANEISNVCKQRIPKPRNCLLQTCDVREV